MIQEKKIVKLVIVKYIITLYNLITKKYRGFVTCVYYYDVIITFCYKTSDLRKEKIVKLVIVKCIIYVWMNVVMWVNN